MDRLSPGAREALGAYRDTLAIERRRVDRNWAAIERRAGEATDAGHDDGEAEDVAPVLAPPVRTRSPVALGAAVIAVVAAAVAVIAARPQIVVEHGPAPSGAAAFDVIEHGADTEATVPTARAITPAVTPAAATPIVVIPEPVVMPAPVTPPPARVAPAGRKPAASDTRARPEPTAVADDDPARALLAETALLRRARAALRDGDTRGAIAATDEHTRRFRDGTLAEEIALVRLTALCEGGRLDEGRAAARAFATRFAGSPLASRAARACGGE